MVNDAGAAHMAAIPRMLPHTRRESFEKRGTALTFERAGSRNLAKVHEFEVLWGDAMVPVKAPMWEVRDAVFIVYGPDSSPVSWRVFTHSIEHIGEVA